MVDQRLDAMSAKPLQSMEVSALSAAGRFMRLVRSTFTVPKPAAMQEMGHLRTAHGVGPAADRDAGGRWVRIIGGFEGAHGLDGVGGCYCGPGAGWQPFQATSTPTGAGNFGALLLTSVRSWEAFHNFGALLISFHNFGALLPPAYQLASGKSQQGAEGESPWWPVRWPVR